MTKWDDSKNCWSLWIMRLLFPLIIIKNNGNNNASTMINDIMTSHHIKWPTLDPLNNTITITINTVSISMSYLVNRLDRQSRENMKRVIVRFSDWKLKASRFSWYVGNNMLCDWNIWRINEPSLVKMIQLIFYQILTKDDVLQFCCKTVISNQVQKSKSLTDQRVFIADNCRTGSVLPSAQVFNVHVLCKGLFDADIVLVSTLPYLFMSFYLRCFVYILGSFCLTSFYIIVFLALPKYPIQ